MSALLEFGGGASAEQLSRGVAFVRRVEALVQELGSTWTVEFKLPGGARRPPRTLRPRKGGAPPQPSISQVALWQITGTRRMPARNMFEVNDYARQVIAQRLASRFTPQVLQGDAAPNVGALFVSAGFAFRDLVVSRFIAGGGDLSLAPLSASHLAYKLRLGYPTKIGTMTGQTLEALRRAQPIARRR